MGILNINDDSFSGDGCLDPAWALDRACKLASLGADIIDVGAESARTNRAAISEDEEVRRLEPFLQGYARAVGGAVQRDEVQLFPPLLSVNTWRPGVVERTLAMAGDLLNDMGALPTDANARHCAHTGAALLIMHSVGAPKEKHTHIVYDDVMPELETFFRAKLALAESAGLAREATLLDPGIDFAKQGADNLHILRETERLAALGRPVLLPVSRKSVIGKTLGIKDPCERDAGTVACLVAGYRRGASIFRVHNVEMAWRTLVTLQSLEHGCS